MAISEALRELNQYSLHQLPEKYPSYNFSQIIFYKQRRDQAIERDVTEILDKNNEYLELVRKNTK